MYNKWIFPDSGQVLVVVLCGILHQRSAWQLSIIIAGIIFVNEQNFHDLKEIEGAGQQQVRSYPTNIGVFHLNMWVHTTIELWAWNRLALVICDRSSSPWDGFSRRPSHAERRCSLRREVLKETFFETFGHDRKTRKITRQFYKLMKLVA